MLRKVTLVLALATLASCIEKHKHFYKLHSAHEKKRSACDVIVELSGTQWDLKTCFRQAASVGGNVVNFLQTQDKHDNNLCQIVHCEEGNLRLVDAVDMSFHVYVNEEDSEKMQCSTTQHRFLSCWTCQDAASEEACTARGTLEPCDADHAVCYSSIERTLFGVVKKISRGCYDWNQCTDDMWGEIGETEMPSQLPYEDATALSRKCSFGALEHHSRCYELEPALFTQECSNGWIHFVHAHDGKALTCETIVPSTDYTMENCLKLACKTGGNMVAVRNRNSCQVHRCTPGKNVIDFTVDIDHGWNIYAASADYKCDASTDRVLTCKTCNSKTEEECAQTGTMEDCKKGEDVCVHARTYTAGVVTHVKRGCGSRTTCTMADWNSDIATNCKAVGKLGKTCKRCMYDKSGADHSCHEPLDDKCVKTFNHVKAQPEATEVTRCRQLYNNGFHYRESCFNLACEFSANMVLFGGSFCEVYSCDDVAKPVFNHRKAHNMLFYYKRK